MLCGRQDSHPAPFVFDDQRQVREAIEVIRQKAASVQKGGAEAGCAKLIPLRSIGFDVGSRVHHSDSSSATPNPVTPKSLPLYNIHVRPPDSTTAGYSIDSPSHAPGVTSSPSLSSSRRHSSPSFDSAYPIRH